jgi:hypothetical protein
MGFEDMADASAAFGNYVEHPVDVALRIDDDCDAPTRHHVTAIAQSGGLDDGDVDLRSHVTDPGTRSPRGPNFCARGNAQTFVKECVGLPRRWITAILPERSPYLCDERQLVVDRLQVAHRLKLGAHRGSREILSRRDFYLEATTTSITALQESAKAAAAHFTLTGPAGRQLRKAQP